MRWFWLDLLDSPRQLAGLDGACGRVGERGGSLLSTAFFGDSLRKKLPMQTSQFLLPDQLMLSDCNPKTSWDCAVVWRNKRHCPEGVCKHKKNSAVLCLYKPLGQATQPSQGPGR